MTYLKQTTRGFKIWAQENNEYFVISAYMSIALFVYLGFMWALVGVAGYEPWALWWSITALCTAIYAWVRASLELLHKKGSLAALHNRVTKEEQHE